MGSAMHDELAEHLNALERDECYRVDAVLKNAAHEVTERVFFVGANGSELGPFVRKRIDRASGLGAVYRNVHDAQKLGRRFRYLPRILECCEAGGEFVVIMEHVGKETLSDVVYRCDPSVALACDVFPRLCDAVAELHEAFDPPIIHRDLKPSNIMLSQDSLTIIDFGIARSFKEGAEEDTCRFGTKAYAPPEQFGFGQTDARSDVYALGMLLYFCLTERTPDARVRKVGFRSPAVPEPFRRVIERAASFDPEDRYADVAALKRSFADALLEFGEEGRPLPSSAAVCSVAEPSGNEDLAPSGAKGVGVVRIGRILSKIPLWVGVAWDVALVLLFAASSVMCISLTVDASSGSAQYAAAPLWLRAISYGSLDVLIMAPILFSLSDRRPLRAAFPSLGRMTIERDMAVSLVLVAVGLIVFFWTGSQFPSVDSMR